MKKQEVEDEKKVTEQVYECIKIYLSSLHIRAGTINESLSLIMNELKMFIFFIEMKDE